jgi:hypothetical protein
LVVVGAVQRPRSSSNPLHAVVVVDEGAPLVVVDGAVVVVEHTPSRRSRPLHAVVEVTAE